MKSGWKKVQTGEVCTVTKMFGKKTWRKVGKMFSKKFVAEDLRQFHLRCTQRDAQVHSQAVQSKAHCLIDILNYWDDKCRMSRDMYETPCTTKKAWNNIHDLVVSLERNVYGQPLTGLLWERRFEKVRVESWMGESTYTGMSVCSQKAEGYSCQFTETIQWWWKKKNCRHMWKSLKVEIDLGDPTPITNQVYFREKRKLTCNQSNLKLSIFKRFKTNGDATEMTGRKFHSGQQRWQLGALICHVMPKNAYLDIVNSKVKSCLLQRKWPHHASMVTS